MKKFFKFLLVAGIIGGLIFGGLKLLDVVTFDYMSVVDESMEVYYTTASKSDLEPITELLDKYVDDVEKVEEIQDRVDEIVSQWVDYISGKYLCNSVNANACKVQLDELKNLQAKIEILEDVESENGDLILTSKRFDKHLDKVKALIKTVNAIVKDSNSTSPKSEFEEEKEKCATILNSNCENCSKTGVCNCTYVYNNGSKEILTCFKPELATK